MNYTIKEKIKIVEAMCLLDGKYPLIYSCPAHLVHYRGPHSVKSSNRIFINVTTTSTMRAVIPCENHLTMYLCDATKEDDDPTKNYVEVIF